MARWRDSRQMGSQLQNQRARAFQLFRDSYTYTEELNSDKVVSSLLPPSSVWPRVRDSRNLFSLFYSKYVV